MAGIPLAPPLACGPLDGLGVAGKDLIAVEGYPTGGGVPAYLAAQSPQKASAPVVTALRQAGRTWRASRRPTSSPTASPGRIRTMAPPQTLRPRPGSAEAHRRGRPRPRPAFLQNDFCHEPTIYNTRQCFGFTTETDAVLGALAQS